MQVYLKHYDAEICAFGPIGLGLVAALLSSLFLGVQIDSMQLDVALLLMHQHLASTYTYAKHTLGCSKFWGMRYSKLSNTLHAEACMEI